MKYIVGYQIMLKLKMGMDTHGICNLLNVGNRAVEQQRYRIKKTLKISENLDEYIQEL